jgi:hypothetical protein
MREISQTAMLAEIDITVVDDTPVVFSVEYITSEGEYRNYPRLAKNFKPATNKQAKKTDKTNNYRVKEKGDLRVWDFVEGHPRTLKIDGIIFYNQMKVV